ncbi:cell wall anchor protein [Asanoa sp. WMMD1127]|uniref:cell wall anchor protein n=1 Tax=Asanoa sp. WMMD1127 TaxID=3016107 RepID=UPI0024173494|nr:cell wall anchor protein [Asanoa sp. WMMD1127]MDG4821618.1 cell wall anchor protein [Asanoa sp. WMMD1127]
MNSRLRAAAIRAGAATVLAVGLVAMAGPAYAADGPDVAVTPISLHLAKGVKEAKAKPFQVELRNFGNAGAKDVSVKLDLSNLTGKVGYVTPDGCTKSGKAAYACPIGDIAAGQDVVIGIPLFNANGRKGTGGYFSITAIVPGDTNEENNSADVDVTVEPKTYDLTVWAQDIYAEVVPDGDEAGEETRTPVPAGGTAPLDSAIFNHGSKRVVGLAYSVKLPAGATIASAPENCFPWEDVNGIICEDDEVVLKPGEVLLPEITVKVADDAAAGVLTDGIIDARALEPGATDPEESDDEARQATQAQRKNLVDADEADNQARFDIFVGAAPTQEPTEPGEPGNPGNPGGGGGGLPVTGPQTALIAGAGAAILAAGVVLLLAMRRRRTFTAE